MNENLSSILFATEQCVSCGMCLPYCPTYSVDQCEAESPRGRISLVKGLLEQKLKPSASVLEHIDNCLQCRSCESMCPANVKYGKIIDTGKAWLYKTKTDDGESILEKITRWLMRKPGRIRVFSLVTVLYRKSRVNQLFKLSGLSKLAGLQAIDKYSNNIQPQKKWCEYYPSVRQERGKVAMFMGCISRVADSETIQSSIDVLNKLGYSVYVPEHQTCCGALDYHSGDQEHAMQMIRENVEVFSGYDVDAIISTSSGCGGFMLEYQDVVRDENGLVEKAQMLSSKVKEIGSFLNEIDWPDDIQFRSSSEKVLQHIPCSLSNILRKNESAAALLSRVPGLEVHNLPANIKCCGAGGLHVLRGGNQATVLRERIHEYARHSGVNDIVTSNIGCALHISSAAGDAKEAYTVRHPVDLLNYYLD
jgi:glycolate oxidase iron-sulfur subunit